MNGVHQKIIEQYVQAYNRFDVPGMTKDMSPDIVFENISDGQLNLRTVGKDAFINQAESAKDYFTQREQTIRKWKWGEDRVLISIDYEATLAIDFPDGPKKGETLRLQGISEFQFRNDKIISLTDRT